MHQSLPPRPTTGTRRANRASRPGGDGEHPRPATDQASAIRATSLGRFVAPYGVVYGLVNPILLPDVVGE